MNITTASLRALSDAATDILIFLDKDGHLILSNQSAHTLGLEQLGQEIVTLLPPTNFPKFYQSYQQSLLKQSQEMCHIYIQERLYQTTFYPHKHNCAVCFHDITENFQLSNELRELSNRLDFAEKTAQIGYWELDWQQKKIYWSAEMYNIFGLSPQQVNYKRNVFKEHIYPEDLPQYKEQLQKLIKNKHPIEGRLRLLLPTKKIIYCSYKASIISTDNHPKIAGTFQDITSFIKAQQALEKAKYAAEKANRDKSYFLAQASHDLRQPMQALNIFIAALFDEKLSAKEHDILSKIEASAQNLSNLLNNLLDISKLDSGGIKYEPQEFNIGGLIQNIANEYSELASCKHIKFHALIHNGDVYSDPILIERIIRNLLSNAFKYTKNKIVLGCKREQDNIRIMILDNGPGISEAEKSKIFEEFYQSSDIIDNRKQGAGLGLTIVSKIATVIDTKIEISSKLGQGSCFSFLLPLLKF